MTRPLSNPEATDCNITAVRAWLFVVTNSVAAALP